jgi:hypothetical protein
MAVVVVGALSRLPHAAAGHRGEMPLPYPTCRRPPSTFGCGGTLTTLWREGTRGRCARGGASPLLALPCLTEFFAARDPPALRDCVVSTDAGLVAAPRRLVRVRVL